MNCDQIQRELLTVPHPEQPSAEVASHLGECAACRLWQERLVGLERQIPQIRVPRSEGKRELIRTILAGKGGEWERPRVAQVPCSHTWAGAASHLPTIPWPHALTLAAASVLLAVCGWWLFTGTPNQHTALQSRPAPPADPLLTKLSDGYLRLTQARTPQERVEELSRFVDHLHDRTQTLVPVADAVTLRNMARLYERVIQDGVVRSARTVLREQRMEILLPLAERLARVGDEAERWIQDVPFGSEEPLRQIAASARTGNQQLYTLLGEGTP